MKNSFKFSLFNGSSRRRLSLTVSARRVENPELLGNDFDDRPLLPIAILPTPALDPPLDEGVPPFGQEFGTDLCQPSERNDAEPLHGLLRDAFGVLPSFARLKLHTGLLCTVNFNSGVAPRNPTRITLFIRCVLKNNVEKQSISAILE